MPTQNYRGERVEVNPHCVADTFVAILRPDPAEQVNTLIKPLIQAEPLLVEHLPFEAVVKLRNIQARILPWEEYNLTEGRVIESEDGYMELPFEIAHFNKDGKLVVIEEEEKRHAIAAIAAAV